MSTFSDVQKNFSTSLESKYSKYKARFCFFNFQLLALFYLNKPGSLRPWFKRSIVLRSNSSARGGKKLKKWNEPAVQVGLEIQNINDELVDSRRFEVDPRKNWEWSFVIDDHSMWVGCPGETMQQRHQGIYLSMDSTEVTSIWTKLNDLKQSCSQKRWCMFFAKGWV